ncbi:hypothetical protein THRCLA_10880, partial [Thraustotheca clavata]
KRKNYITQLQYAGGDLFAPGGGERSLLKTLKDLREILENRVLPMISCERAQASAKDHLTVVESRATDALIHGVQFLFNIFRNTSNAPADCTITNLQSQQHASMKEAMNSKSGQMLLLLLSTPSFSKLFPESHFHVTGGESKLMALTSEQQLQIQNEGVFCDAAGNAAIPNILTVKEMTPKAYLTQSNSGVITFLTEDDYNQYTKMHGLLKLLADLIASCRQARLLAGTGGDLLVYGPGGAHLRLMLETMQAVEMEIVQCATTLKQRGVAELDKLRSSYSEKNWRICFSRVLALETYLINDVSACNDPIRKICDATNPTYVLQAAKEFKAQTNKWVLENASACGHIADTLQLKNLPPLPTLPSSQVPTITATNHLNQYKCLMKESDKINFTMAGWGVRWNPWDRGYSGLEVEQMSFLHKSYCEVYGTEPKDLPHILQMDEKFHMPLYSPQVSDFDEHTFVRKMQDMTGLLRNPAEGIIASICAYQRDRNERVTFNAYLNDPRTLLLEEIKSWALNTLASAVCTTEFTFKEVENRIQYIKKIQYGQQKLFTSGSGERSLMATLKDVREILEYR